MERREAVDRLREIQDEIEELANEALRIVRDVGGDHEHRYAKGYWYAHIVTALRDDAGYVGGSMGPLSSTIESLARPECPSCGEHAVETSRHHDVAACADCGWVEGDDVEAASAR